MFRDLYFLVPEGESWKFYFLELSQHSLVQLPILNTVGRCREQKWEEWVNLKCVIEDPLLRVSLEQHIIPSTVNSAHDSVEESILRWQLEKQSLRLKNLSGSGGFWDLMVYLMSAYYLDF